jgi:hypothetical protein
MFPSPWAGLARNTDPQTSKDAAATVNVSRLESIILDVFSAAPKGLTQDELAARLPNHPLNTLTPRLAPLIRKGYLVVDGKRPGKSRKNQRVLKYVSPSISSSIYDDEQGLDYFNRFIAGDR